MAFVGRGGSETVRLTYPIGYILRCGIRSARRRPAACRAESGGARRACGYVSADVVGIRVGAEVTNTGHGLGGPSTLFS
jgi:hypothetical protein